jgi:hypothetical protein
MPEGAGVATGPVKFVVDALRRLDWTWKTENRWKIGPFAHTCASVMGVSAGPPVVGRDWSPVYYNIARGYCCRTPGGHRAPPHCSRGVQPGRRHLRTQKIASRSPEGRGRAYRAPRPQFASHTSYRFIFLFSRKSLLGNYLFLGHVITTFDRSNFRCILYPAQPGVKPA